MIPGNHILRNLFTPPVHQYEWQWRSLHISWKQNQLSLRPVKNNQYALGHSWHIQLTWAGQCGQPETTTNCPRPQLSIVQRVTGMSLAGKLRCLSRQMFGLMSTLLAGRDPRGCLSPRGTKERHTAVIKPASHCGARGFMALTDMLERQPQRRADRWIVLPCNRRTASAPPCYGEWTWAYFKTFSAPTCPAPRFPSQKR